MSSRRSGHGKTCQCTVDGSDRGIRHTSVEAHQHLRRAPRFRAGEPAAGKAESPDTSRLRVSFGASPARAPNLLKRERILPSPACGRGAGGEASRGMRRTDRSASNPASPPWLRSRGPRCHRRCRAQAYTWRRQDPSARRGCAAGKFRALGPLDDRCSWMRRRPGDSPGLLRPSHCPTHALAVYRTTRLSWITTPRSASAAMYSLAGIASSGVHTPGLILPSACSVPVMASE